MTSSSHMHLGPERSNLKAFINPDSNPYKPRKPEI